jgi:hypothetical protein
MVEIGQLSVRLEPAGGKVADQVKVLEGASPQGRRNLVLLIHGYANSQADAAGSFQACINNLEQTASQAGSQLISPIFKFYWPGDTKLPVISQLSYPWEIEPARDSASRLADFLQGLAGPGGTPVEIHFVSHSLGGRVVLETLKHFYPIPSSAPIIFKSMSMMAAAVPVHMAGNSNQFLYPALIPQRRQVLFSSSDLVLMIAFRVGELVAGEGFFPEAVGTYGHPNGMWQQKNMNGYEHWEYWPSAVAACYLSNFLEVPVAVPPPPNAIGVRSDPATRDMPSAQLSSRSTPTRAL